MADKYTVNARGQILRITRPAANPGGAAEDYQPIYRLTNSERAEILGLAPNDPVRVAYVNRPDTPWINITGVAAVGGTLSAEFIGCAGPIQWYRDYDSTPISGATTSTYVVQQSDNGHAIYFRSDGDFLKLRSPDALIGVINDQIVPSTLSISGTPLGTATVGTSYSFTPAVSGGNLPYSFSLIGSLPAGLSFNTATGAITGTPTATGVASGLVIRVQDQTGAIAALSAFSITVGSAAVAPVITTQPTAQTVTAGATATFTAAASGTPTPSVKWQRSTNSGSTYADISGATSTSYTSPATTVSGGSANNGDLYRAVFTNAGGTVTSNAVALTVNAAVVAPTVTTQPSNASATEGGTATFTAVFTTGGGSLAYQWQKSGDGGSTWANVSGGSGANSASYTTAATTVTGGSANNNDRYRCTATNSAGSVTTNGAATLTVIAAVDLRPRFLYAVANPTATASVFDAAWSGATVLPGSSNNGKTSTNWATTASTTNYTWVFFTAAAAASGVTFSDGTGTGNFSGALSAANYTGLDTTPTTVHVEYVKDGVTWYGFRSNVKAVSFSTNSTS